MSIYLSPGVYVKEKDISEIISGVSTTTAALVGYATKGQVGTPKLITTSQQFINEYGIPTTSSVFHYTALAFLQRGSALYCVRVVNSDASYGGLSVVIDETGLHNDSFVASSNSGFLTDSIDTLVDHNDVLFQVFGKDPGAWNSDISISITDVTTDTDGVFTLDATESYCFSLNVWYKGVQVETFRVSRQRKVDGYGRQLYIETKVNGYSNYIVVWNNETPADTIMPAENATSAGIDTIDSLGAGLNGTAATPSQISAGWSAFANPDDTDIRILLNGGETSTVVQKEMIRIAELRADCFAILDMPDTLSTITTVQGMVNYRRDVDELNANTSYASLYSPWIRVNDSYNDEIVTVPPSGYVGAAFAYNDYAGKFWSAPAGFNRGLLNVLGLTHVFTKVERDTLYSNQINPIQTFRGEGIVIWGQKTLQAKTSALSSVNVRRLLIIIEKVVAASLRYFLFEPNDETTRYRVVSLLDEYFADLSVQGAFQTEGGDGGYAILCDSTNNTPIVIDNNEMHVDVFIKPIRAAETIQLQMIVTKTGASFNELISQGVQF